LFDGAPPVLCFPAPWSTPMVASAIHPVTICAQMPQRPRTAAPYKDLQGVRQAPRPEKRAFFAGRVTRPPPRGPKSVGPDLDDRPGPARRWYRGLLTLKSAGFLISRRGRSSLACCCPPPAVSKSAAEIRARGQGARLSPEASLNVRGSETCLTSTANGAESSGTGPAARRGPRSPGANTSDAAGSRSDTKSCLGGNRRAQPRARPVDHPNVNKNGSSRSPGTATTKINPTRRTP